MNENEDKPRRGRGRPRVENKINPMWKDIMLESGEKGKHTTEILIELGISWNGHYAMLERNKEYKQTYSEFLKLAENYWFNLALDAMNDNGGNKFNTRLWETVMKNRFKENWKNEKQVDITSQGEKINGTDNKIQVEIIKKNLEDGE
jgi:hypothetical protein